MEDRGRTDHFQLHKLGWLQANSFPVFSSVYLRHVNNMVPFDVGVGGVLKGTQIPSRLCPPVMPLVQPKDSPVSQCMQCYVTTSSFWVTVVCWWRYLSRRASMLTWDTKLQGNHKIEKERGGGTRERPRERERTSTKAQLQQQCTRVHWGNCQVYSCHATAPKSNPPQQSGQPPKCNITASASGFQALEVNKFLNLFPRSKVAISSEAF